MNVFEKLAYKELRVLGCALVRYVSPRDDGTVDVTLDLGRNQDSTDRDGWIQCVPWGLVNDGDSVKVLGRIPRIPTLFKHWFADYPIEVAVAPLSSGEVVGDDVEDWISCQLVLNCIDLAEAHGMRRKFFPGEFKDLE